MEWTFRGDEVMKLVDKESDMAFRRIEAGLGWPFAQRPGFVIVLAEDFSPDHALPGSPRHFRILDESESGDLEKPKRICHKFNEDFSFGSLLGNPENPIHEIWKQLEGSPMMVTLPYDFEKIDLNLIAQLVKQRTETRKTLHFGESKIPGFLSRFASDKIEAESLEEFPAMVSFGFTLAQLALRGGFRRPHFFPDRSRTRMVNRRIWRR